VFFQNLTKSPPRDVALAWAALYPLYGVPNLGSAGTGAPAVKSGLNSGWSGVTCFRL